MPPPEIVFDDAGCNRGWLRPRCGLFGHACGACDHCGGKQKTFGQVTMTPLAMTSQVNSVALVGGQSNFAGGLQMLTAAPALPVATAQVQLVHAQSTVSEDFAGLRAIHEAEVRAASIAAARARQDAELRSTIAALDRARANVAAATAGECNTTTKDLATAATTSANATAVLVKQVEQLTIKLNKLEQDVRDLTKIQQAMYEKMTGKPLFPNQPNK